MWRHTVCILLSLVCGILTHVETPQGKALFFTKATEPETTGSEAMYNQSALNQRKQNIPETSTR